MITQKLIKKIFDYNPENGEFIRVLRMNKSRQWVPCRTKPSSNCANRGYTKVGIDGVTYYTHRLIWLWMTGEFPDGFVDHINGDQTDNRWSNFRVVNFSDNVKNTGLQKRNKTGHTGIYINKQGRYFVNVRHQGRTIYLGSFDTLDEAIPIRKKAEQEYGFHSNHGKRRSW